MNEAEHVARLRTCAFTLRQARFLVLVLEHSGVCLPPSFPLRASAFALSGYGATSRRGRPAGPGRLRVSPTAGTPTSSSTS